MTRFRELVTLFGNTQTYNHLMVASHCVHPIPDELRQMVRRVLDEHGPTRAAQILGISRLTVLSVTSGLQVSNGTLALLTLAQQRLDAAA